MNEPTLPVQSLKTLFISSAFATILAIIILIIAILPAEYGIDLTGLGKAMGLTQLAPKPKSALSTALKSNPGSFVDMSLKTIETQLLEKPMAKLKQKNARPWKDIVTIIIPPMKGLEYKFYLRKGADLAFEWQTDGTKLYFDFHGEPEGDMTGYFKSFKLATDNKLSGTLTALFAGSHGWYWKNKTQTPVKIILKTKGDYQILGII